MILGIWISVSALNCWADPTLPTLFTDHMVLQQGREIHVWGKGDPSEKVTATLAGHRASAVTDPQGNWGVHLPPMTAGGPFTLTIHGKKEVVIRDVMIGEVWLASGQSNMTFSLEGAEGAETEVPKANYPQIRLFTVPKDIAVSSRDNTRSARWEICTPGTAKPFSAVAYFFAHKIEQNLKIPIGIVESAWPGTAVEQWISSDILRADPNLKGIVERWWQSDSGHDNPGGNPQSFDLEFDDFELIPASQHSEGKVLANFDDGASRLTTGGSFSYSWSNAPNAAFDLVSPGHGPAGFAARVAGRLDGTEDSILMGTYKLNGDATDLSRYAGIRFWVRGEGSFRFRSKEPTITDHDDYAAPVMQASAEWKSITIWFRDLHQDGWGVVKDLTPEALTSFSIECLPSAGYVSIPAAGLYNGMITPLLPYAFRGVLWYQGESNAWKPREYRTLLPALIRSWRENFHNPELEFLIVQLPNHGEIPKEPGESDWAQLREAQLMTVKDVPHTGLAVTIDVGDPKDLHPHRKLEVGERLALWALGTTYKEPIEYSGPLYESGHGQAGAIRLQFTHIGTGLEAQGTAQLQGFAIAGADHKFYWAEARIEGNSVIVSSPEVPDPVAVRYAWGDSPPANLFNKEGLPASPFRTDDWMGNTEGP